MVFFIADEAISMLAEKFFLVLETLISRRHPNGAPDVVSNSPHVPFKFPAVDQLLHRSARVLYVETPRPSTFTGAGEGKPMRRDALGIEASRPDDRRTLPQCAAAKGLLKADAAGVVDFPIGTESCQSQTCERLAQESEGRADITSDKVVALWTLR